jgi:regulator of protease activity HflC (stomatin/prohibitin superfamily)
MLGIVAVLGIIFISQTFTIINAGERGIVLNWGAVSDTILDEGFHILVPVMQKVEVVDVRTQKEELDVEAYSKDIQTVTTTIALNYHVLPETVNTLWQEIGEYYILNIVDPAIQESVKAATAQFTAQELIEKRSELKQVIKDKLTARLNEKYIYVDNFSIVNFQFTESYEIAVEEKQVAQQEALKAENELVRIKVEAEQQIAKAQADAESIRIQAEALRNNNGLIDLKAVEKWNGVLPYYMMGDATPFINIK